MKKIYLLFIAIFTGLLIYSSFQIFLWLNDNKKTDTEIKTIQNATLQYYQLTQFKRAYFECVKTEYDKNTSRIIFMEFKFTGNFG